MHRSTTFAARKVLFTIAALMLTAGSAFASPFTLTYDFAGGPAFNPPPFSATSISPTPPFAINPTFTASSTTVGNLPGTAVRQSSFGLGVASIGPILGVFTEQAVANQLNQVDGYGIFNGLFGLGQNNLVPEVLQLTFSETDPLVVNTRVTQITLDLFTDIGPLPDFEILLNGTPIGTFHLASTIVFSTPIAINNGDVLSFIPLTPVNTASNGFALRGLQLQADILPEPGTWLLLGMGFALAASRLVRRTRKAGAL
jgi:hypothetical protein